MRETIASSRFLCVRPTGERLEVEAVVGRPYQTAEGDWACPASLRPLQDRLADICGGDSLQALCLAASLLRNLLTYFAEEGGKVLHCDDESEVDLDAVFSGVGREVREPNSTVPADAAKGPPRG